MVNDFEVEVVCGDDGFESVFADDTACVIGNADEEEKLRSLEG
jgi:hypothetical protein